MQLELPLRRQVPSAVDVLVLSSGTIPVFFFRNPRAARYVLRLQPDGTARVTIPRGGSKSFARQFAQGQHSWLEKQLQKRARRQPRARTWTHGTEILFRGETVALAVLPAQQQVRFADQVVQLSRLSSDLRPEIERHLRQVAVTELSSCAMMLAATQGLMVRRVQVRDQRTRWGSCSARGTISLNWRLIQTPPFVRDYLILHELMHLKEMNHSKRFWRAVQQACPEYQLAERWLNQHSGLLREGCRL